MGDACNLPLCPKTWLEQIANKFSDTHFFVVCSEVFPNLHHNDYAEEVDLGLCRCYRCPGMIMADQVKYWMADRKAAKLVLLIQRWDQSGNGDSQLLEWTTAATTSTTSNV
jgi:hypothetical protein